MGNARAAIGLLVIFTKVSSAAIAGKRSTGVAEKGKKMSKAVLISIKPEWCEKIARGIKTVEVRKTKPKIETPFKCYIYCTNDRKNHFWTGKRYSYADERSHNAFDKDGNGKVIGEFTCDRIIDVDCDSIAPFDKSTGIYIDKQCCLSREELWKYTGGHCAHGWHILELKIYNDQPKALSKFGLTRPPQSWCYVEQEG